MVDKMSYKRISNTKQESTIQLEYPRRDLGSAVPESTDSEASDMPYPNEQEHTAVAEVEMTSNEEAKSEDEVSPPSGSRLSDEAISSRDHVSTAESCSTSEKKEFSPENPETVDEVQANSGEALLDSRTPLGNEIQELVRKVVEERLAVLFPKPTEIPRMRGGTGNLSSEDHLRLGYGSTSPHR